MRTINLTMLQCLSLDGMLGGLQGKRDSMAPIISVRKKLAVDEDERKNYLREVPGGVLLDKKALAAAPELALPLTEEEARRVRKALEEWECPAREWDWALPILEQLEQPYKPETV